MAASSTFTERAIPKSALTHLDFLRGAAATLVLVGHVRGLFFVDWDAVARPSLFMKLVYLTSGLGHECVIIFFVLSGFFIGHSVLAAHRAGTWDWGHYGVRRLSRLYVVLVPGLVLTVLLDLSGMHLFGSDHGIYAGEMGAGHLQLADARKTIGVGTFLANLFFLQNLHAPEYGTNGPLWSLSYEFWYYAIFPMAVQAVAGSGRILVRVVLGLVAVTLLAVGGKTAAVYFVIWGMGAAIAFAWQVTSGSRGPLAAVGKRRGTVMMTAALAVFAGTLFAARIRALPMKEMNDVSLGIATAVLVWMLLVTSGARPSLPTFVGTAYGHLAKTSARFSFTLYVVHFPLLAFIYAFLGMSHRWEPDALHLIWGMLLVAGVALLYAYPVSRVTEAHTDDVRRWFERTVPFLTRTSATAVRRDAP